MELEEIKKDKDNLIKELEILNMKYRGVLEYLAVKEKGIKEAKEKETPKDGE